MELYVVCLQLRRTLLSCKHSAYSCEQTCSCKRIAYSCADVRTAVNGAPYSRTTLHSCKLHAYIHRSSWSCKQAAYSSSLVQKRVRLLILRCLAGRRD